MADLAELLRERHWSTSIESRFYTGDGEDDWEYRTFAICNQDGQAWPCFTERMIRQHRGED